MSDNRYLSRSDAEALAQKVLSFSTADEARVNINSGTQGNTRFAQNQVSTAGDAYDANITITSAFGKKTASATTNRFDDEALRQMVQTSERLARLVPEDPEYMGELEPQQYISSEPYFDSTAEITPEARARAVMEIAGPAMRQNLVSTGFLSHFTGSNTVANKKGLFAYARGTGVSFTTTVRTPDGTGSGWAGADAKDWKSLDVKGASEPKFIFDQSFSPPPAQPLPVPSGVRTVVVKLTPVPRA